MKVKKYHLLQFLFGALRNSLSLDFITGAMHNTYFYSVSEYVKKPKLNVTEKLFLFMFVTAHTVAGDGCPGPASWFSGTSGGLYLQRLS